MESKKVTRRRKTYTSRRRAFFSRLGQVSAQNRRGQQILPNGEQPVNRGEVIDASQEILQPDSQVQEHLDLETQDMELVVDEQPGDISGDGIFGGEVGEGLSQLTPYLETQDMELVVDEQPGDISGDGIFGGEVGEGFSQPDSRLQAQPDEDMGVGGEGLVQDQPNQGESHMEEFQEHAHMEEFQEHAHTSLDLSVDHSILDSNAQNSTTDSSGGCEGVGVNVRTGAMTRARVRTSTPIKNTSAYSTFDECSFVERSIDDSDYIPDRKIVGISVPNQLCFVNAQDILQFVKDLNVFLYCKTRGCGGRLVPVNYQSKEGAISMTFNCNTCKSSVVSLNNHTKYNETQTRIGLACQIAFIASGGIFATYKRTLKLGLGMEIGSPAKFLDTLALLHPVLKSMLDQVCQEGRDHMKCIDPSVLGSWERAVTTADVCWMTRGHHSKNFTFSIRNYFTGALLYYCHLCQRGTDSVVDEPLYEGTSKSMEGFAARKMFQQAKDDGMIVEVQWQDADSSSSNRVQEVFPDAEMMVCGGHAGRAHKKRLETFKQKKHVDDEFINKHKSAVPDIATAKCCCPKRHKKGCGCLSKAFISQAHTNFSMALSQSNSADEFRSKILALVKHACNIHSWTETIECNGESEEKDFECGFHPLFVCSCGKCKDKTNFECAGKPYQTRNVLKCDLHGLLYEIECRERAKQADMFIHPELKRGSSNLLEASHNVFIRFRSKMLNIHRLHYHVSTNMALLQSNMTYMFWKRGADYHWIVDLYKHLQLEIPDGLQEKLTAENEKRKQQLEHMQTEEFKRRRIQLKKERKIDNERRKEHTKKHGDDVYGEESGDDDTETKTIVKAPSKSSQKRCQSCGQVGHLTNRSKNCLNYKSTLPSGTKPDIDDANQDNCNSDDVANSSLDEFYSSEDSCTTSDNKHCDDDLDDMKCTCHSFGYRSHSRSCPMNPRHRIQQSQTKVSVDCTNVLTPQQDNKDTSPPEDVNEMCTSGSPPEADGESTDTYCICRKDEEPPMIECSGKSCLCNNWCHFKCVGIKRAPKKKKWYCPKCNVSDANASSPSSEQVYCSCSKSNYGKMIDCHGKGCPGNNLFHYACIGLKRKPRKDWYCASCRDASQGADNVKDQILVSDDDEPRDVSNRWVQNPIYVLNNSDKETITNESGWLHDNVITSVQNLLAQQYPLIGGLQPPVFAQRYQFAVQRGEFVQILNVRNDHWITVSNIGASVGEVNIYDSASYPLFNNTANIIASIVHSETQSLKFNSMNVAQQVNSSNCGVLAIAFANYLCSGLDPCLVEYDQKSIRMHLVRCLENCQLTRFPVKRQYSQRTHTVSTAETIQLCLECHMPTWSNRVSCVSCSKVYHPKCVGAKDSRSLHTWRCKLCLSPS